MPLFSNIFDSHSHYDDHAFDDCDRDLFISEIFGSGVKYIMHAATDLESSEFGIAASKRFGGFFTSVGVHPDYPDKLSPQILDELEKLIESEKTSRGKIRAIGEIGLDYHYEGFDREKQLFVFEQQLLLAKSHSLPVIVHSREATEDTLTLLKKHKPSGVVHCFSGSVETAKEVLALGMFIGLTGVVTFKNSKKAQEVAKTLPSDRLLLETDCPYMAPEPNRGKRSDSRMIAFTAAKIAELRGMDTQDLIDITNLNAKRLFDITD